MGMSVGENKGGAMAEMNVVPLIDILLVLLIIFMVITPLTPKGLDTLVPQPNPNQQQNQDLENKTVVVQVLDERQAEDQQRRRDLGWPGASYRSDLQGSRRERSLSSRATTMYCSRRSRAPSISCARNGIDKVGLITAKLEAGQ